MASVAFMRGFGFAVKNALVLLRTIWGKAWEHSSSIFRQIESVGPKSILKLGQEGVTSELAHRTATDKLSFRPVA